MRHGALEEMLYGLHHPGPARWLSRCPSDFDYKWPAAQYFIVGYFSARQWHSDRDRGQFWIVRRCRPLRS